MDTAVWESIVEPKLGTVTQEAASATLGVSWNTFLRLRSGAQVRRKTKHKVLSALKSERSLKGVDLTNLFTERLASNFSFSQILDIAHCADISLMKKYRSPQVTTPSGASKVLSKHLSDVYYNNPDFHNVMLDPYNAVSSRKDIEYAFSEALRINVASDLSELKFDSKIGGSFKVLKPELLWDCACLPNQVSSKCKIHSEARNNNVVAEAMSITNSAINIGELSPILWRPVDGLWPPSIDSLYLIIWAMSNKFLFSGRRFIFDIGCGTGALGVWLSEIMERVEHAVFSDVLSSPMIFSAINCYSYKESFPSRDISFDFVQAPQFSCFEEFPANECIYICNPPYLPYLDRFSDTLDTVVVSGTGLLEDFIEKAPRGALNIISLSNIALPVAMAAAERSGKNLVKVSSRRAPFRVRAALENEEYLGYLLENGLQVPKFPNEAHQYYHEISIFIVE